MQLQKISELAASEQPTKSVVLRSAEEAALSHASWCEHLPWNFEALQSFRLAQIRRPGPMPIHLKDNAMLHVLPVKVRANCVPCKIFGYAALSQVVIVLVQKDGDGNGGYAEEGHDDADQSGAIALSVEVFNAANSQLQSKIDSAEEILALRCHQVSAIKESHLTTILLILVEGLIIIVFLLVFSWI